MLRWTPGVLDFSVLQLPGNSSTPSARIPDDRLLATDTHLITAQRHSTEVHNPERFRFPLPEFASDASNLSRTATTKAGSSEAKPNKEISQSERDWAYAKQRLAMGADPEEVVQAITEYRPDKWNPESMHAARWRRQRQNFNRRVPLRKRGIHSTAEPLPRDRCLAA